MSNRFKIWKIDSHGMDGQDAVNELDPMDTFPVHEYDSAHRFVLASDVAELAAEAAGEIADWGAYASEYFQDKHDLDGIVARFTPSCQEVPK